MAASVSRRMRKMRTFIYALRYRFEYDPAEVEFVLGHFKRGDCAVDIGWSEFARMIPRFCSSARSGT